MKYFLGLGMAALGYIYSPWSDRFSDQWLREYSALEEKSVQGMTFGGELRFDRAMPGPGRKITFICTTIKRDAAEFSSGVESMLKTALTNDANLQSRLKTLRDKGVEIIFVVNSRDFSRIATITM